MNQLMADLYARFRKYYYSRKEEKLQDKYLCDKYGIRQKGELKNHE